MPYPRERLHRLPRHRYMGHLTVVFAMNVEDRKHLFVDPHVVWHFRDRLFDYAAHESSVIAVYCFMQDHPHVMVTGNSDESRLLSEMNHFKVSTGRWPKRHHPRITWQGDFYDHIIRDPDDWRAQALYILNNPVRAGLATDPVEYPFSGTQAESMGEVLGS